LSIFSTQVTQATSLIKGFQYSSDPLIDGRIPDGRWKDLKVEYNTFYPDLNAGYGYLRAPWNMNPSPYISRFGFDFNASIEFPSCYSHYEALQFTDMMDFYYGTSLDAHAETHTLAAGYYGCDVFDTLVDEGYIHDSLSAAAVCSQWSFFLIKYWRSGYVDAKSDCIVNTENINDSECGFICKSQYLNKLVAFIFPQLANFINTTNPNSADRWEDFICNDAIGAKGVFTGDHLESASPADPSF